MTISVVSTETLKFLMLSRLFAKKISKFMILSILV